MAVYHLKTWKQSGKVKLFWKKTSSSIGCYRWKHTLNRLNSPYNLLWDLGPSPGIPAWLQTLWHAPSLKWNSVSYFTGPIFDSASGLDSASCPIFRMVEYLSGMGLSSDSGWFVHFWNLWNFLITILYTPIQVILYLLLYSS